MTIPQHMAYGSSSTPTSQKPNFLYFLPLHLSIIITTLTIFPSPPLISCQSTLCRSSCGQIPINYPFGIDDGCGSPYYRHLFVCSEPGNILELRTPSGRYPVHSISYSNPHIIISDPFMWNCQDGENFRPTRPFSLDTSTHLKLSHQNEYIFFNCSEDHVIVKPRPMFCDRDNELCDSCCDSASYLCRHLPDCASELRDSSCCSYYPKASSSLRLMLNYCASYASIYWRSVGKAPPLDQVPKYGIRVDFDIPVTMQCLMCEDRAKGGGTCGFDTETEEFLCLCEQGNVTTYCKDHRSINSRHSSNGAAVAGTVSVVLVAGAVGIGAGIWYLKKVKVKAPVTCGVQTSENRLF